MAAVPKAADGEAMKLLFVILDGAGDVRINKRTALEAAKIPFMDKIAASGITGMLCPIRNVAPESDEAVLSLMGYDPFKFYPGRGPVEACGIRKKFSGIAIRGDFSLVKNNILKEPAAHISDNEARHLCSLLNRKIGLPGVRFIHSKGYRFVLLISKHLNDRIQSTHPGYVVYKGHVTTATSKRFSAKPKKCVPLSNGAKQTAVLVNNIIARSAEILESARTKKKVNFILLRGAGSSQLRLKKLSGKWLMFADSPADIGIGRALGMSVKPKPESNVQLARAVVSSMHKFDKFFVQIKSPDKCSHQRDRKGKIRALEAIDKEFFGYLDRKIGLGKFCIVLTADHSTSSVAGTHLKNNVPIAISSLHPDNVSRFGERPCSKGSLKIVNGPNLMKIALREKGGFK